MSRMPQNVRDLACWQMLHQQGFTPSRRGWPNFIAWQPGKPPIFVVIRRGRGLKYSQRKTATALAEAGLRVYIFTGTALVRFVPHPDGHDVKAEGDEEAREHPPDE